MVGFKTTLLKFDRQGEKTGWTYIEIPAEIVQRLKPGNKKTFRVKGKLDNYSIKQIALLPMGEGNFIMPLNAAMRKGFHKRKGEKLNVQLEVDERPLLPPKDLMDCLADEPHALKFFQQLAKSHQNYFTKWIQSAKTEPTKAKRIAQSITALSRRQNFGEMLRALKKDRENLYRN
jgi:hypothetical protein